MKTESYISLVVFDIAGTLMEDTGTLVRSFSQAFEHNQIPASEAEIQEWRGAAKRDVVRHFVSRNVGSEETDKLVDKIYQDFRARLEENYKNEQLSCIPGAEDTLKWLKDRGILLATNTGFYRAVRDLVLHKLGWDGSAFDCNVCSDDVPRGRPSPYMIFECMSRLGITDVNQVIVIGDTPLDLQAGCSAGCRGVIGVLTGAHGIETLGMSRHTHIIASVAKLPELMEMGMLLLTIFH